MGEPPPSGERRVKHRRAEGWHAVELYEQERRTGQGRAAWTQQAGDGAMERKSGQGEQEGTQRKGLPRTKGDPSEVGAPRTKRDSDDYVCNSSAPDKRQLLA